MWYMFCTRIKSGWVDETCTIFNAFDVLFLFHALITTNMLVTGCTLSLNASVSY